MKCEFFLLWLVNFNPSGRSAKISCGGWREPLMIEPSERGKFNPLGGESCVHSPTRMNMLSIFFTVYCFERIHIFLR